MATRTTRCTITSKNRTGHGFSQTAKTSGMHLHPTQSSHRMRMTMNDKTALFFTKDEILDVLDILEDARFRVQVARSLEEGSNFRCERTIDGLDDLIHRFNLATSCTKFEKDRNSGLTNDPDGWYNG